MTQAEKLEALVLRAQNQGFDFEKSHPLLGEYKGVFSKNATLMSVDESGERWYSPWPGLLFSHDFARALFGDEKREWLGKYSWYSLYEQDGYTFQNAQELLDSWIYQGGEAKPTATELENLPPEGVEVCAGMIEKLIETTNEGFEYHLQQAVISDNPIDYMHRVVFE
jgi:hypothetical protein